jgi:hypothetical protein
MANTTTLNETLRSPLDGTENVRLATAGANWKAQLGNQTWVFGGLAGGTGAASSLVLESTTGVGTSDFIQFLTGSQVEAGRIDTSGNVNFGNGGAAVTDNLSGTPRLQLSNTGDGIDLRCFSTTTTQSATVTSAKSHASAIGTLTGVGAGEALLNISAGGYDATGGTPVLRQGSQILFEADAAPTAGSVPGRIRALTSASGNASPTEAMRIDSGQNVNIGTQGAILGDPTGGTPRLQVTNTVLGGVDIRTYSTTNTTGPQVTGTKSHNATLGTNTGVTSGEQLLSLVGGGFDITGTPAIRQSAIINLMADAAATAGSIPGRIAFYTAVSGSATPTEAYRIDQHGVLRQSNVPGVNTVTLDASNNAGLIITANSNAIALPAVSAALCAMCDFTGGTVCLAWATGGNWSIVNQAGGANWAVTSTPAVSTIGIAFDGTNFRIYNGYAASHTFFVLALRVI